MIFKKKNSIRKTKIFMLFHIKNQNKKKFTNQIKILNTPFDLK